MPIYRGMPGYEERVKQLTGVRPDNWRNNNRQPKKKDIVVAYRKEHPDASRWQCQRDTGLSINTVRKWWNIED